tara:strand:- start:42283 stop:42930 length:648 start_codon:yes stop_codon:yes gene_type:complete
MATSATLERTDKLFSKALAFAVLTVVYNVIEGLVSVYFGHKEDTLALFGFGLDSFVETISALGIAQMILRIKRNPNSDKSSFEILSLKITGWCFYGLIAVLIISAINNVISGTEPASTLPGIVIAGISIVGMWALIYFKISIGKKLNSAPIIADAKCNQVCLYMSLVLLLSSGLWWLFKIPYIDILGTIGIIYFAYKEGKEAFAKAKGIECCGCD